MVALDDSISDVEIKKVSKRLGFTAVETQKERSDPKNDSSQVSELVPMINQ